jgi:hypothetical protein
LGIFNIQPTAEGFTHVNDGEKAASSTNVARKTGHLNVEN